MGSVLHTPVVSARGRRGFKVSLSYMGRLWHRRWEKNERGRGKEKKSSKYI